MALGAASSKALAEFLRDRREKNSVESWSKDNRTLLGLMLDKKELDATLKEKETRDKKAEEELKAAQEKAEQLQRVREAEAAYLQSLTKPGADAIMQAHRIIPPYAQSGTGVEGDPLKLSFALNQENPAVQHTEIQPPVPAGPLAGTPEAAMLDTYAMGDPTAGMKLATTLLGENRTDARNKEKEKRQFEDWLTKQGMLREWRNADFETRQAVQNDYWRQRYDYGLENPKPAWQFFTGEKGNVTAVNKSSLAGTMPPPLPDLPDQVDQVNLGIIGKPSTGKKSKSDDKETSAWDQLTQNQQDERIKEYSNARMAAAAGKASKSTAMKAAAKEAAKKMAAMEKRYPELKASFGPGPESGKKKPKKKPKNTKPAEPAGYF